MMLDPVVYSSGSLINPKFWELNKQASKANLDNVAAIDPIADATIRSVFPRPI